MLKSGKLYCSFCNRSRDNVKILLESNFFDAHICENCVTQGVKVCERENVALEFVKPQEIDFEVLGVKPKFKRTKFIIKSNHCFYLSPFKSPFNEIYADHVAPIAKSLGLSIERADEIYGTQPIIEDIWESINVAELIIADVTEKNPNVLYEIGIAHTIGKPVLIITQDINDVPFDLKHYRCIIYDYNPRGCKRLEEEISKALSHIKTYEATK